MSEILLGQSYFMRFDPKLYAAMQPYPPLGALYAAGYLRAHGHDVAVFDAMLANSELDWEAALAQQRPRFAVLYEDSFNYLSKMCLLRMRQAAFEMICRARERGCVVIVSGSDATDRLAEYLTQGADYILIGEGEITLNELITAVKHGAPVNEIRGLAWRDKNGTIQRAPPRHFIRELDRLPFPAWDLVDIERYRRLWRERHGYFSMNLVTTRGCPYHCNWCAKPIYGQRYNSRTPENVVAEMRLLKDTFHPDQIEFADDIFGLRPGWIERFADLVHEQGAQIPFKCLLRADLLTDGVVTALARAGCATVWMGAESGSQKILDAMEKGTRVEQIYRAAERLHRAGIRVGFFLQYGYRGEDGNDIARTLQMVRDCRPDDIGISVSYPLPGTKFYEQVKAELGDKQNWVDSDDLALMYRGTYSPEFYRVLYRVTHYAFRLQRAQQALAQVLRHPSRWRPYHWRSLASLPANAIRLGLARLQLFALAQLDILWRKRKSATARTPQP
ncbi:MAG: radical SAM protein [Anaerolineae bacterium]